MSAPSSIRNPELRRALERLFALQTFGVKLGLEPTIKLLDAFGSPQHDFPAIHVAGTNGKGSVCSLVASTLAQTGLRVGLYTSPHLVDFGERIRVNGVPIPEERLALYAREMLPVIEELGGTFFEGTTAIGFRYFAEEHVDVAVIETGMGGRLDSTNVVTPLVAAITSIGMDHTKHLGETLEQIAFEKAGIIKPGVPCVIGRAAPHLREVFERRAEEVGAPLFFVEEHVRASFRDVAPGATRASFLIRRDGGDIELDDLAIGLGGRHQIENARVALGVIEHVRERFGVDERAVRSGFASVVASTGIRGRFEQVQDEPRVFIDVAHNVDGARVLVDTVRLALGEDRLAVVYGAVEDKEVSEILEKLAPITAHLFAVRADSPRSLPSSEIARRAAERGIAVTECGSVADGVERAIAASGEWSEARGELASTILVCGSFFVVGEAIEALGRGPRRDGAQDGASHEADALPVATVAEPISEPYAAPAIDEPPKRRPTVKEWSETEQPRERLMERGAEALSDAELLAILLRTGTRESNVLEVSRQLLRQYQSLSDLARRDWSELRSVPGIGPTKAVTLAAAFEIARRARAESFSGRVKISGPKDIAAIYIPELRHVDQEEFHVVVLNTANQIIRRVRVSQGNLNSSIVHPREVYRYAVIEKAAAIIGVHNHPSGNPQPSREDIAITRQLVESGQILGIPLHDHIIIAGEEYVSLAEKGYV